MILFLLLLVRIVMVFLMFHLVVAVIERLAMVVSSADRGGGIKTYLRSGAVTSGLVEIHMKIKHKKPVSAG